MAGEYDILLTSRFIVTAILAVLVVVSFGIGFLCSLHALLRYQTGWKALTQRFPAMNVHKLGGSYKRRTGFFGSGHRNGVNGMFLIEPALEGFLVTASFARRSPILIPWPAIRDVVEANIFELQPGVLLTVDYETPLKFSLPADASTVIRENVTEQRLHKVVSVSELVKTA